MKKLIFSIFMVISPFVLSANHGSAGGIIKSINVKETGYILITFESNHANTMECESLNQVVIASTNPDRELMLSLALTAYATGDIASYWITGCYSYYGSSYSVASTASVTK